MKYIILLFFILAVAEKTQAQQVITLRNPSFEGLPQSDNPQFHWKSLNESTLSTQPGQLGCTLAAYDGKTYLSLVTRDDGTYEAFSQHLGKGDTLKEGRSYKMSVYLAKSNTYKSFSSKTGKKTNYNQPIVLRVWSYNSLTNKEELLTETEPIKKTEWTKYELDLKCKLQNADSIIFEAFYDNDDKKQYNGNLLIDNLSEITGLMKRRYR